MGGSSLPRPADEFQGAGGCWAGGLCDGGGGKGQNTWGSHEGGVGISRGRSAWSEVKQWLLRVPFPLTVFLVPPSEGVDGAVVGCGSRMNTTMQ